MARKRLISPEFFLHGELYDAEHRSGLPLRLAFAGLWTACDRRGLFTWKARELKLSILPHDPVDFEHVLAALEQAGFIERYVVDGKAYGRIPSFSQWQTFHKHEKPSNAPEPSSDGAEPSKVRPEPDISGSDTSITGTVAVAGTSTSTNAVADTVAVSPPAATTATTDFVQVLTADFDFGPFEPSIVGLVRSSKRSQAVIATLRMHLSGELGHELATPQQLGLAVQQFLASGSDFNASYFAGFVKRAKAGIDRVDNRKRNSAEQRHIDAEAEARAEADREAKAAREIIAGFERSNAKRFAELQRAAELAVPSHLTFGRDVMVRTHLIRLIRDEKAA